MELLQRILTQNLLLCVRFFVHKADCQGENTEKQITDGLTSIPVLFPWRCSETLVLELIFQG